MNNDEVAEITITCEKHPSQIITHICCLENCLNALCVKCMKSHNLFHKQENIFPEIETVEDVREFCYEKLFYLIENFNKELEKIKYINSPQKPDKNMQKLSFYKEKMISYINNYFDELAKEYEKRNTINNDQFFSFDNHIEYLKKMVKSLEEYLKDIKFKCTLETLQNILVAEYQQDFEQLKAKNQELFDQLDSQKISIIFDDAKVNQILHEVENISIFNKNSSVSTNNDSSKSMSNHSKLIFETMRNPVTAPVENSIITTSKSKSLIKNETTSNFLIKNNDYFNKATTAKFLHFFQQKSRYLHIYNLEELKNNNVKEYTLEMNIEFKIPRWHRSIALPNGSIYLIGGVVAISSNQETTSNMTYIYDFEENTLHPLKPMLIPRSGHGIAYLNEYIYCVGGFTNENVCSVKCEKYCVTNNVWEIIADLNYEANNACICSFQNRYLYKFGGKLAEKELNNYIERYCPIENIWGIVHIKSEYQLNDFTLLSSAACCQINRNQILVFGGTYEDYSQKSNQSFLIEITNQNEINKNKILNNEEKDIHILKCINEKALPFSEGFWNNNPLIFNSELYCLQNIPNKNNLNIVYNDRRRILKFDSKGNWVSYN